MSESKNYELKPITTLRASESIFEQIKELITSGKLKPGDRLPSERKMMDMLQRSRPTIREALRMLERAGFIKIVHGSNGAIVQELSVESIQQPLEAMMLVNKITLNEVAEIRAINETGIARLASERRTEDELSAMEDLLEQSANSLDDFEAFIRLDSEFHSMIARMSKNELSIIIIQIYKEIVSNFVLTKFVQVTEKQRYLMCLKILGMHRAIYEGIKAQDPELTQSKMLYHLEAFNEDLKFETIIETE